MALHETNFPGLSLLKRGKVRDIYDMGDAFLFVASDRISAYDMILNEPVPDKGKVLTQISLFWFEQFKDICSNHVISGNVEDFPQVCKPYAKELAGRSMLVKKARPLPIECIVRGYISGSGWTSYQKTKSVCGIPLPEGLKESDKLPENLFTPSTKAEMGEHDENIDLESAMELTGKENAEKAKKLSLAIYEKGRQLADERGIIIADTKFEFGLLNGEMLLIDEVLTPDSSRFWPKDRYQPGGGQFSFDKQYVRDYLTSVKWDKKPPVPPLPEEVIDNTRAKYIEAYELLTGRKNDF